MRRCLQARAIKIKSREGHAAATAWPSAMAFGSRDDASASKRYALPAPPPCSGLIEARYEHERGARYEHERGQREHRGEELRQQEHQAEEGCAHMSSAEPSAANKNDTQRREELSCARRRLRSSIRLRPRRGLRQRTLTLFIPNEQGTRQVQRVRNKGD